MRAPVESVRSLSVRSLDLGCPDEQDGTCNEDANRYDDSRDREAARAGIRVASAHPHYREPEPYEQNDIAHLE